MAGQVAEMNPYREPGELQDLAHDYNKGLWLTPPRMEQYMEAIALLQDLVHPEQYGHAVPPEVRRRAQRVLGLVPK